MVDVTGHLSGARIVVYADTSGKVVSLHVDVVGFRPARSNNPPVGRIVARAELVDRNVVNGFEVDLHKLDGLVDLFGTVGSAGTRRLTRRTPLKRTALGHGRLPTTVVVGGGRGRAAGRRRGCGRGALQLLGELITRVQ